MHDLSHGPTDGTNESATRSVPSVGRVPFTSAVSARWSVGRRFVSFVAQSVARSWHRRAGISFVVGRSVSSLRLSVVGPVPSVPPVRPVRCLAPAHRPRSRASIVERVPTSDLTDDGTDRPTDNRDGHSLSPSICVSRRPSVGDGRAKKDRFVINQQSGPRSPARRPAWLH